MLSPPRRNGGPSRSDLTKWRPTPTPKDKMVGLPAQTYQNGGWSRLKYYEMAASLCQHLNFTPRLRPHSHRSPHLPSSFVPKRPEPHEERSFIIFQMKSKEYPLSHNLSITVTHSHSLITVTRVSSITTRESNSPTVRRPFQVAVTDTATRAVFRSR